MTSAMILARPSSRWRPRPSPRSVLLTALIVVSLVLLTLGWIGGRLWQARNHLTSAVGLAQRLSDEILAGEADQARATLDALQRQTAAARSSSADPLWSLAAHTPYAGDNLAAIRSVAVTVDELARRVFPALVQVNPRSLVPRDGRTDLTAVRLAAGRVSAADSAAQRIRSDFAPPSAGLARPVRDAVARLRDTVDRLATVTSAARRAGALLPRLLGGDGRRTYLLLFQNLAEARATGGIFGAYAVLSAAGGRIRIVRQGASADLGTFSLPVDRDLRDLYGELPGIYPADVNLTPDFPLAAARYRDMYQRRSGESVDGVLATDPVALAYLLRVVGPVTVAGGATLTGSSAVRELLADVYLRVAPDAQDRYFARAAKAVFDALLSRPVDPPAMAVALGQALSERRLLFWSTRPDEQALVAGSRVGGVLPDRETQPTIGVFLNDGSGAKLGYYLTRSATVTAGGCRPDRERELVLRVTLGSTAPRSGLTDAVLGLGMAGDPYTTRTLVAVYSPAGGSVASAALDGRRVGVGAGRDGRRQVGLAVVDLRPGQSRTLRVSVLAPATATGTPQLWLTPGVTPWTTSISSAPPCNQ